MYRERVIEKRKKKQRANKNVGQGDDFFQMFSVENIYPCMHFIFILYQAYDQHHRLDNSMVQLTLNITLREGDPVFQR